MESKISMICLGVADLEKSIAFYEKGLGLRRKPFDGPVAFFDLDGRGYPYLDGSPWRKTRGSAPKAAVFRG